MSSSPRNARGTPVSQGYPSGATGCLLGYLRCRRPRGTPEVPPYPRVTPVVQPDAFLDTSDVVVPAERPRYPRIPGLPQWCNRMPSWIPPMSSSPRNARGTPVSQGYPSGATGCLLGYLRCRRPRGTPEVPPYPRVTPVV